MARSRRPARWLSPLVGIGFAAAALLAVHGCGTITSGDCTDKATCTLADAALDGDAFPDIESAADEGAAADSADVLEVAMTDAEDASACSDACALTPTQGWSLVAFAPSRTTPCPSGFTTTDVVDSPTSGTCTCGQCMTTVAPSCGAATLPLTVGQGCNQPGTDLSAMSGQCVSGAGFMGNMNMAVAPVPATGGACAAPASANPASVTTNADRICTPQEACLACGPEVTTPFTTCLAAPGPQSCPPGTTQKHSVGTAPVLSCTACGCSMMAECGGAVTFYQSSACGGSGSIVPVTGTCTAGVAALITSYQYASALTMVACTSGTSMPVLTLSGEMTVCCP